MKTLPALFLALAAAASAQNNPTAGPPPSASRAPTATALSQDNPALPKFDLNFDGGQPELLVKHIEQATKQPLNVIIPEESQDKYLPALKMKGVTVPQLFEAIEQASRKQVARITGYSPGIPGYGPQYQQYNTSYGFRTKDAALPNAVWQFYVDEPPAIPEVKPPAPPAPPPVQKVCRFFQLAPYLDDYKVEDITTAVETAWQMLGPEKNMVNQPEMKFHQDTRLLIVVGPENKVSLIENVLLGLQPQAAAIDPSTGLPIAKQPRAKAPPPAKPSVPVKP